MFTLADESSLLMCFRPRDRMLVTTPRGVTFPLISKDYLAWNQPEGKHVYLICCPRGGAPLGIVFDGGSGGDPSQPQACDWCHCAANGQQIGLLTTRVDARRVVGVHVCLDLSCKDKLEDLAHGTGRSSGKALERILERMSLFASQTLHRNESLV